MRFRTRVVLALGTVAIAPLIGVTIGVHREVDRRLAAQDRARATALADVIRSQLARDQGRLGDRLAALREALIDDNRFRLSIAPGRVVGRSYLLDYATDAMRLTGLDMLQIQDDAGRILSSGHFRNEFDRLEPALPTLLRDAPGGAALVDARVPEGRLRVLARVDSVPISGRRFTIVGGIAVDDQYLAALTPDTEFAVTLRVNERGYEGRTDEQRTDQARDGERRNYEERNNEERNGRGQAVAELPVPFIGPELATGRRSLDTALFVLTHSSAGLTALERRVELWFSGAVVVGIVASLSAALWLATQVSRPLMRLAGQTARLDLDHLDVGFAADRGDEVGDLARLLRATTQRLRSSAMRLRDAERRATMGEVSRQVAHDVKNGLVPIRHVLRHLTQVHRDGPEQLAAVFAERRSTLDSSVEYLDGLVRAYAQLSRRVALAPCDLNVAAREAAASAAVDERVAVHVRLDERSIGLPLLVVSADPLVLRRILDNLISNAIDAAVDVGMNATVTIGTVADTWGARIFISDSGRGMTEAQLANASADFHTTKPHGAGLGLSIVRRLTTDLGATLRIETAPGRGTRVEIGFARGGKDEGRNDKERDGEGRNSEGRNGQEAGRAQ